MPNVSIARTLWMLLGVCALFALALPTHAQAQRRDFGLGLVIGDPTGLSVKGFLDDRQAIDGALGFGFIGDDHISLHADYLYHFDIKRWDIAMLDLYIGVGPKLGLHDHGPRDNTHILLGARAPIGLALTFLEAPFDIFLELAAGLWLVENVDLYLDAAIGGRYWF
jgi:hypothetical protein